MTDAPAPRFRRLGLLRLSWPLLVLTVLTLLAALGNVVILSLASPELNAAVSTANQILGVLYDVSVIFSIGALVVIAQLLGAGAFESARRAVVVALRASAWLGLGIALFVAVLGPVIVSLINTPDAIVADTFAYLWVVSGGMAFNAVIVTATAVLRAYGRTALILALGIVINLLDVTMLALCVLVLDLGPVGAALPSLVIRGIGVALLFWLVRRATGVHLLSRVPSPGRDDVAGLWRMTKLSLPTVIENGGYNLAILAAVSIINTLGTEAINARSYALTLTGLVTGVVLALAQGNETIVGWDKGGDAEGHARRLTIRTAAWTAAAAAVLALALWASADSALAIFGADGSVAADARRLLLLSVILLPLSGISTVLYGALRSAGDVAVPMTYSLAASAFVLLPLSWLLVPSQGLAGAWWALIAAEAVKAALLLERWLRGRWARIPSVTEAASR